MSLSDIAEGVEVTTEQQDRGVPTVDDTDTSLAERLADYAESLPCEPAEAATVVEVYAEGKSIEAAAHVAEIAPMTAAKTLHLLGEHVTPLGPTGRDIVEDWCRGRLSRSEAQELTGASEPEFALGAYIETHDPIEGAQDAVAATLTPDTADRDPLAETMSDIDELPDL